MAPSLILHSSLQGEYRGSGSKCAVSRGEGGECGGNKGSNVESIFAICRIEYICVCSSSKFPNYFVIFLVFGM